MLAMPCQLRKEALFGQAVQAVGGPFEEKAFLDLEGRHFFVTFSVIGVEFYDSEVLYFETEALRMIPAGSQVFLAVVIN